MERLSRGGIYLARLDPAARHRRFHCDPFTPESFVAHLEYRGFASQESVQMVLEGASPSDKTRLRHITFFVKPKETFAPPWRG